MKAMKYSGFLVCCIVLCVFFAASSYAEMPTVGIVTTGGTLEKAGAILGGDLTGAKARLLLMLAIAKEKDDVSKIKVYFKR